MKSSVFEIKNASSFVTLKDVSVKSAPSVITKQLFPVVKYKKEDIKVEDVNHIDPVDLNNLEIYDDLRYGGAKEFYEKYKDILNVVSGNYGNIFILQNNLPIVKRDIIVPEGVTLKILPGTNIKLENKVSIVSYGTILANGTNKDKFK